ncbi:alpha/beta hydrolase [Cryobacterium sp. TMS1-20-1]|uniref:alpha/beta fold hydrolase n=1 Tax=Cryobacterium sp. TMS1-20-1 TaxID=1259223 RepID=UPI00106BAE15|nr:alpha/beta hydrolase [Cryobacterium sp. TMS1-20-1]
MFALADALGIDKFIHFGFSQGCLLALRAVLTHPERFVGLIQCSTQAGGQRARRKRPSAPSLPSGSSSAPRRRSWIS